MCLFTCSVRSVGWPPAQFDLTGGHQPPQSCMAAKHLRNWQRFGHGLWHKTILTHVISVTTRDLATWPQWRLSHTRLMCHYVTSMMHYLFDNVQDTSDRKYQLPIMYCRIRRQFQKPLPFYLNNELEDTMTSLSDIIGLHSWRASSDSWKKQHVKSTQLVSVCGICGDPLPLALPMREVLF